MSSTLLHGTQLVSQERGGGLTPRTWRTIATCFQINWQRPPVSIAYSVLLRQLHHTLCRLCDGRVRRHCKETCLTD